MNLKNKSVSRLSPYKAKQNRSISKQQPLLKGKWDQIPSATKSSKSSKSLHANSSLTKSTKKTPTKQFNPNSNTISKQYTKSTFQRYQQKLSIQQKIADLISQINQRESHLKSYFEIYRLLESQIGQQRCLEHNNDLSLYCVTENKVLCVHCIYGESKHKTHKVLPLKDCLKDVGFDNQRLQETIKRDIDTIKLKIKTSQMNEKFIEKHFKQQLQQLEKVYVEKLRQIEVQFCQKKAYVTQYFEVIKDKNSQLTTALKDFQKNITLKLSILGKEDHIAKHDSKLISKQTILSKISELSNLNGMAVQDLNQKDIAQTCLRNRVTKTTKK